MHVVIMCFHVKTYVICLCLGMVFAKFHFCSRKPLKFYFPFTTELKPELWAPRVCIYGPVSLMSYSSSKRGPYAYKILLIFAYMIFSDLLTRLGGCFWGYIREILWHERVLISKRWFGVEIWWFMPIYFLFKSCSWNFRFQHFFMSNFIRKLP